MSLNTAVNIMCKIYDFSQWTLILGAGAFANKFDYEEDMHRIIVTIIAMSLGTLTTYFIKKGLERCGKKKNKK